MKNFSFKIFLAFAFCFGNYLLPAKTKAPQQQRAIDSVLTTLYSATTPVAKLEAFIELAWMYRHVTAHLAKSYSDSVILLAEKLNLPKKKWFGLNSKAEALSVQGNLVEALKLHQQALKLAETNNLKLKQAHTLNNIGNILREQDNQSKAIEYTEKARDLYAELNDTNGIITVCINLGNSYKQLKKYEIADKIYSDGLKLSILTHDLLTEGKFYTNMGHCAYENGQYPKAKEYYYKSLIVFEKHGGKSTIAEAYANYGYMLWMDGDIKTGLNYYQKALAINRATENKWRMKEVFSYMAELYLSNNDFKNAYYYADSSRKYNDLIFNESNARSLNEMQERFDSEKKQLAIESLSKENAFKEKRNKQQKLIITVVGIALLISIVMGFLVFKQYKEKNKANKIIASQKAAIEEKQKEIVDSINYAKRIQYTLLAHEEFLKENLPDHFVYFNPKDIVSGDFYWATKHNNKFYLAVCDSTGHGVPGAFMSLLNIGFLNEAINEKNIDKPNEIFDYVRLKLINSISKEGQQDGFDGILLCFDPAIPSQGEAPGVRSTRITYAAANNAPILIKNGPAAELIEAYANRMPVGVGERKENFTLHTIEAKSGDMLYLYTDGYADQFGGPKGKKFKYKQLNELLVTLQNKPLNVQKTELNNSFENWKANLEQVDDVCVIGIKL